MKKILLAFLFLTLSPGPCRADSIFVLSRSVNAILYFSNLYLGVSAEVWTQVDVTTLGIPADATSVSIQGVLAVQGGTVPEYCFMYLMITPTMVYDFANSIAVRSPTNFDVVYPAFGLAEVNTNPNGSVRVPFSTQVPVVNGKFFYIWTRNTTGEYPTNCSYGANLVIQSYTK